MHSESSSEGSFDETTSEEFNPEEFMKRNRDELTDSDESEAQTPVKKARVDSAASRVTKDNETPATHSGFFNCKTRCLNVLSSAIRKAKGGRKEALEKTREELLLQKTPSEVAEEYGQEIARLEAKIEELKRDRQEKVENCRTFWQLQVRSLPKSGKLLARIRPAKVGGRRWVLVSCIWVRITGIHYKHIQLIHMLSGYRKVKCPLASCHGETKNLSRHLAQVHRLVGAERDLYTSAATLQEKTTRAKHLVAPKQSRKECVLCSKHLKRVDSHLAAVHGLKRGSKKFKTFLQRVGFWLSYSSPHMFKGVLTLIFVAISPWARVS